MKQAKLMILLSLYFITTLQAQTAYTLTTPATNQAGSNSSVTGSCSGVNNVTITRVDLSGNPVNFRTLGNAATLQLALVVNTDNSTNWASGGTSPVFSTIPTYIRFDSRDNFGYPSVTPTFLPIANRYRLKFDFSPASTNPVINFSGTANREIVALVPATVITPVLALDGSTGGRVSPGGALLPSPTFTLISNGVRFTGSHGSDRYNVGLQLTGSISSAIVELTELVDVGTWVNSLGASIWSQIDNMGVAVSGSCGTLPTKLENFTGNVVGNTAKLNWIAVNEYNVLQHQVEMSNNGVNFQTIGNVAAQNLSRNNYQFEYNLEREKKYFFRLKIVDRDGSYNYSSIVHLVSKLDKGFSIKVSPNPARDYVTIQLPFSDNAEIRLFSSSGEIVKNDILMTNNTAVLSIKSMPRGVYFLKVTKNDGEYSVQKVIIE